MKSRDAFDERAMCPIQPKWARYFAGWVSACRKSGPYELVN
ncbi:hypothetical protein ACFCWT_16350 [Streptomyces olivaceus]